MQEDGPPHDSRGWSTAAAIVRDLTGDVEVLLLNLNQDAGKPGHGLAVF